MKKKFIFCLLSFFVIEMTVTAQKTVTDIEGNVYKTVIIGTQIWMAENLKTTKYNDGTEIPLITNKYEWKKNKNGAFTWYDNNETINKNTYGNLYNWHTVKNGKLCPTSWHIPTDSEWTTLTDYLGVTNTGNKLKETETEHWISNKYATNETGFTALPGGRRDWEGNFKYIGVQGWWWSSTEILFNSGNSTNNVWFREMTAYSGAVQEIQCYKEYGLSIRCLFDFPTQSNIIDNQDKFKIYPNPVKDFIYINNIDRQASKIKIYNILGDCIFQSDLNKGINEIDLNSLIKGIYFIRLTGGDKTILKKLIKE